MTSRDPILKGTLDMLVLRTLERHELHGFEIAEAISQRSSEVLQVEEGSLYPALQRLMIDGFIKGTWGRTDENRRARYYRITVDGRRQLKESLASYRRVTDAIAAIMEPA